MITVFCSTLSRIGTFCEPSFDIKHEYYEFNYRFTDVCVPTREGIERHWPVTKPRFVVVDSLYSDVVSTASSAFIRRALMCSPQQLRMEYELAPLFWTFIETFKPPTNNVLKQIASIYVLCLTLHILCIQLCSCVCLRCCVK